MDKLNLTKPWRIAISLSMAIMLSAGVFAQTTISGKVTDAQSNESLIGVTVLVKNTLVGTVTDIDGNYTLEVPEGFETLVFSYVGYGSKEEAIGGRSSIDVKLAPGEYLEEVVIIGYGAVPETDVTGAVSRVAEDDFNQGAIVSPEQLLEGRTAGVQIVGNSGAPGAPATINIRGTSSIRSGNDPLIVIDGIQLDNRSVEPGGDVSQLGRSQGTNPFNFIDPNEIASIEVLKDASATAIYGSRGANGVIVITTKKGQDGKAVIEYSTQQGISNVLKKPEYLSGSEYRNALSSEGQSAANDFGSDVDALDEILTTGYTNQHSLSVSGGNSSANYRVFGSFFDQDGIIDGSGIQKINGGVKSRIEAVENEKLVLNFGLTASNVMEDGAPISDDAGFEGSLIGAALQWNPTKDLLKPNGAFDQDLVEARNPLAMQEYIKDQSNIVRILGSLGAAYKLAENLTYNFTVNVDQASGERRVGVSPRLNFIDIFGNGQAIVGNNRLGSVQLGHTLNLVTDINENLSLNLLGGYEYLKYTNKGTNIFVNQLADVDLDLTNILQSASNDNQRVESFADPDVELQSYFGRAIFNLKEKYLLTATVRADGSSKFGDNNEYGVFPSFAFAWNMHDEDFAPESFDRLKLRVGYGVTGNQEFPAGAAQEYFTYENGNLTQENNPNPDLQWETSEQFNVGLDMAFADYKVRATVDFFNKVTNDLILFVPLAQPNPSTESRIYRNVDGTITNTGVEVGINTTIINKENLTWNFGINGTYLSNEVKDFSSAINTGAINGQGLTGAFAQRIENGQPLFSYFMPVWQGFNADGLSTYEDPENGGSTIIGTVNAVKQHVGDPLPDFLLGIATDVRFGNFDIVANLSGAFGYQVYNNTTNAVFNKSGIANGRNIISELVGNGESVNNSAPVSTRFLEDGDHIRFSNLSIGYTFDKFGNSKVFKGARLSLTGQNLAVLTGYSGFDPTVNTNKEIDGIPSFGIEYTPYPTSRTFLLGLSVKI